MLELHGTSGSELSIGGIGVSELARRFGTPLYVYDLGIVRRQYQRVKSTFSDFDIFYSVKANGSLAVSSWLRHLGAGAEVASDGELYMMLASGFDPKDIVFAGPAKTESELEYAINTGISAINAESATELLRIDEISRRLGVKTRVALRVNSGVGVDDAPERMVGGPSRFGFDEEVLVDAVKSLDLTNVDIVGFHLYTASDVRDVDSLYANFERTLQISTRFRDELGITLEVIDFGGGFGVPHRPGESELDLEELGRRVGQRIRGRECPIDPSQTRLIWELGRYLVSQSGVYLTKVIDVKESRGKVYAITDGGMNQFIRPVFMGVNHPTRTVSRITEDADTIVDVGGPTCTPIDIIAKDVELPSPKIDDLIGFLNAGAYGFTMSMLYFLGHPLPAEVVVLDGEAHLARTRGQVGDCLVNQLKMAW